MRHMSIRWRLTLWYGVALAVMLCGFCLILLLLMQQQVFARTDAGLQEEIKEIGLEIDLADNADAFRTAAEARFTQHSFYEFLVTDPAGQVIFGSLELQRMDPETVSPAIESTSIGFSTREVGRLGSFRIASALVPSQFGGLHVHVLRSLMPLYAELRILQWVMAGLLPVGVLTALAIGHFLAGRALAPVQRVVDAANAINISCLNRRIEVSNAHDEVGQLAAALNLLIGRLEQAVTETRRFTADASHEIRTPIAALRMETEAALRSPRTSGEYILALTVILDEATRLGRLTDQLLHLSRHDAGITQCAHDPVQLDALLRDVTDQLQLIAKDRGVSLQYDCEVSGEVQGDDIRLSQVFFNVIENAIKYTPGGGHVDVRLQFDEQTAVVEVEDSGIGIPPEDQSRIFDRFYRVDTSRRSDGEGAGLGLSIARTAVIAHHGTIDVRSQPGTGTVVTIRLPGSTNGQSLVSMSKNLVHN